MPYSQENRLIAIDTPLGRDKLLLEELSGHEAVSQLFRFELGLLSENYAISFKDLIGQPVCVTVQLANGKQRYINGFVSRFAQSGGDAKFAHYHAELVPWLWFLTRTANCRIFQNMKPPDIIEAVFKKLGFSDYRLSLQGSYDSLDYCVQYRETDFNFVSRLMEEYGIFYFFEHEKNKHTMVLGDASSVHQPVPNQPKARFDKAGGNIEEEDVITSWHAEQELRPGKYSLTDYNFETPSTSLMVNQPSLVKVGGNSKYEVYDYPGDYSKKAQGTALAKIRMQEEEATHLVTSGNGTCRAFTPGYRFNLEDYYRSDMNASYVITEVRHTATAGGTYGTGGDAPPQYANQFSCIPQSVPFRPARVTPKPFVQGPQTAVVVGKGGEEIYVDKYSRVKVQFYWDRDGKKDENSSCWVRVSQPWAGKNWGGVWIPRIGQEVIVDFLEGDPDHPIITGRVYNAEQMPPYDLPTNMTQSGLKTRSSKGGGTDDFNELRFEDKKGSEDIYFHAQKDFHRYVENDDDLQVYHDQTIMIKNDRTETVKEGNETITVEKGNRKVDIKTGNETLQVDTGDRLVQVKTGNDTHKIDMGNREVKISMGNDTLTISMGNQSTKLNLGQSTTEAMQSIELKVGQSSVKLDQMGVTIKGMMISIEGQIQTQMKGLMTSVNGSAMLTLKGGITMIN